MTVNALRRHYLLLAASSLMTQHAWADTTTLRFGLDPYLSTRRLITLYAPMAEYLQSVGIPVELATASDGERFFGRILAAEFDLLMAPPHICRFLQREHGYLPMLMIDRALSASLVAPMRTIRTLADLRGKRLAIPEPGSMTVLLAEDAMRSAGLNGDTDVKLLMTGSQTSTLLAVRNGLADAGFIATGVLIGLAAEAKTGFDVVMRTRSVPHFAFVAHPRLGAKRAARIAELIQRFARSLPQGMRFIEESGYNGLSTPRDSDLQLLDAFIPSLKRQFPALAN